MDFQKHPSTNQQRKLSDFQQTQEKRADKETDKQTGLRRKLLGQKISAENVVPLMDVWHSSALRVLPLLSLSLLASCLVSKDGNL